MSSDRLVGDWLKGYLGDRLYECPKCGETGMLHDEKYRHELFECPKRPGVTARSQRMGIILSCGNV